jgi:hypothetical protein
MFPARFRFAFVATAGAALLALAGHGASASALGPPASRMTQAMRIAAPHRFRHWAQDAADSGAGSVAPEEVEKYVAVYKMMQRDRSLSVQRAAARQGLTLDQFRALESRIEHDDAARERARRELQSAAAKGR